MKKKLVYLATATMVSLLTLFNVGCKKTESVKPVKKETPIINEIAYLPLASMNQYLDGLPVELGDLNSLNSQFAVYNHEYYSTSVFTFSSLSEMEEWLDGKSFENLILRQNHLCDSMSLIVDENDTTSHDWNLFKVKNKDGNTKLFKTNLGFKFWDGPPSVPGNPPPGTGANKYFWGIYASFGSWNNRATTFEIYGQGQYTFCSQKGFKGRKFFNVSLTKYGHSLLGTTWDNNIMSAL